MKILRAPHRFCTSFRRWPSAMVFQDQMLANRNDQISFHSNYSREENLLWPGLRGKMSLFMINFLNPKLGGTLVFAFQLSCLPLQVYLTFMSLVVCVDFAFSRWHAAVAILPPLVNWLIDDISCLPNTHQSIRLRGCFPISSWGRWSELSLHQLLSPGVWQRSRRAKKVQKTKGAQLRPSWGLCRFPAANFKLSGNLLWIFEKAATWPYNDTVYIYIYLHNLQWFGGISLNSHNPSLLYCPR